jgi:hypothetical protein
MSFPKEDRFGKYNGPELYDAFGKYNGPEVYDAFRLPSRLPTRFQRRPCSCPARLACSVVIGTEKRKLTSLPPISSAVALEQLQDMLLHGRIAEAFKRMRHMQKTDQITQTQFNDMSAVIVACSV